MIPTALYRSARLAAGAFFLALVCGCASLVPQTMALRDAWPEGVPGRTEISGVPFFPQEEYQCGPSALATALVHSNVQVTPEALVPSVYIPERQGSLQAEMLATPRQYGRVAYRLEPRFPDLVREVAAGNPVVILQDIGLGFFTKWHYAVVVGYDYPAGELYLRSGQKEREATPFTILEYTWKKSNYWAMVALPPGKIPVTATEENYLPSVAALERVDKKAALVAYAAALERWPDSLGASVGLSNQQHAAGQLKEAEAVLRRAATRHPDSVVVLNNLAQTLSDQGRNAEALTFIERAKPEPSLAASVDETRELIRQRMAKSKK
jgi:tetratricopeptide (TPR) repeat protein